MKKTDKTTGSKQKSNRSRVKVAGVNPDDPKMKSKWEGYEKYEHFIDSLNIDAKWKGRIKDILYQTILVGKRVIEIGKKIVEAILAALKKYPKVVPAMIVGSLLAMLASHIPILGWLLAPVIMGLTIMVSFSLFLSEAFQKAVLNMFSPLADARRV